MPVELPELEPPTPEKSVIEEAMDDIAKLCGCAEWDYAGQVVRDVGLVVSERNRLRAELAHARPTVAGALTHVGALNAGRQPPRGAKRLLVALREQARQLVDAVVADGSGRVVPLGAAATVAMVEAVAEMFDVELDP
jgi:hypothetical protein